MAAELTDDFRNVLLAVYSTIHEPGAVLPGQKTETGLRVDFVPDCGNVREQVLWTMKNPLRHFGAGAGFLVTEWEDRVLKNAQVGFIVESPTEHQPHVLALLAPEFDQPCRITVDGGFDAEAVVAGPIVKDTPRQLPPEGVPYDRGTHRSSSWLQHHAQQVVRIVKESGICDAKDWPDPVLKLSPEEFEDYLRRLARLRAAQAVPPDRTTLLRLRSPDGTEERLLNPDHIRDLWPTTQDGREVCRIDLGDSDEGYITAGHTFAEMVDMLRAADCRIVGPEAVAHMAGPGGSVSNEPKPEVLEGFDPASRIVATG